MTTNELIPAGANQLTPLAVDLVAAFFSGRKDTTLRAYRQSLEDFRAFTGAADLDAACRLLLENGPAAANGLALAYRSSMVDAGRSAATVNARLAALRSLVKLARTLGLVVWKLEISNVKAESYRDTKGPGNGGFRRLLDVLDGRLDAKARRDRAAVRLLYDLALRRAEVVALDLEDVDLEAGTVAIVGKGKTSKTKYTLPDPTKAALADWIDARGTEPGPLFTNFDRAGKGGRLTGRSLHRIVKGLGEVAGVEARPHGLRHAAITKALDLTNGNVRAVQRFSRHADVRTLQVYDDNRQDLAGEVAALVAG